MAQLLKGAEAVSALNERIKADVSALVSRGVVPTLAILRVGEKPDDLAYERGAIKRAETVGVAVRQIVLPETVSQESLLAEIERINADDTIHGCLMLRPLPKHIDDLRAREALLPEKDIDGITEGSLAGVFAGTKRGFPPCTAQACMEILDYYGVQTSGKRVTVIGRSLVVGKPAAMMLIQKNATVTVCHTKTVDMPAECRKAEILIVAAGRAGIVGKEYFSEGQTVIDVGINVDEQGNLCGDVNFGEAEPIVGAITPVPGGVGTVTTSGLVKHVIEAAERKSKK